MGFALKLKGVSKADREQKVREAAKMLDLEKFLDRKPKALSGGQRQRVAMGRAIVREPSVFLMDEPLSNLDAKLRVETRANIAALQARLGTTTIYVTHDQVEAMTMGDRVAVLKDGTLQQVDTPRNLSGGQRQRVAMGRAIVREPKVFCMDEPLSNLDAQLRVQTRTQIAELQRRLSVTTVYVTHDQVEAMTMGERVAVMRAGQLQQFASPTELYDHPANVFVAGFIGSPQMNRLAATADRDGVRIGDALLPVSDEQRQAIQGHSKLVAGIRPEHLSIGDGPLSMEVSLVEDLGSDSFVYGHLAGDTDSSMIVRSGRVHPRPGETVKLAVDTAQLHLFDEASGLRLGD
jgi:ABC-type sugar transport system ATPase subunit